MKVLIIYRILAIVKLINFCYRQKNRLLRVLFGIILIRIGFRNKLGSKKKSLRIKLLPRGRKKLHMKLLMLRILLKRLKVILKYQRIRNLMIM